MLAIRIGYGGVVSEELALPLLPADCETAHRIWRAGRACQQTVIGMDCGEEPVELKGTLEEQEGIPMGGMA